MNNLLKVATKLLPKWTFNMPNEKCRKYIYTYIIIILELWQMIICLHINQTNQCILSKTFNFRQGLSCPTNYNPADFFIFQLAISAENEQQCFEKVKVFWCEILNDIALLQLNPYNNHGCYCVIKLLCDSYEQSDENTHCLKTVEEEFFTTKDNPVVSNRNKSNFTFWSYIMYSNCSHSLLTLFSGKTSKWSQVSSFGGTWPSK